VSSTVTAPKINHTRPEEKKERGDEEKKSHEQSYVLPGKERLNRRMFRQEGRSDQAASDTKGGGRKKSSPMFLYVASA